MGASNNLKRHEEPWFVDQNAWGLKSSQHERMSLTNSSSQSPFKFDPSRKNQEQKRAKTGFKLPIISRKKDAKAAKSEAKAVKIDADGTHRLPPRIRIFARRKMKKKLKMQL